MTSKELIRQNYSVLLGNLGNFKKYFKTEYYHIKMYEAAEKRKKAIHYDCRLGDMEEFSSVQVKLLEKKFKETLKEGASELSLEEFKQVMPTSNVSGV